MIEALEECEEHRIVEEEPGAPTRYAFAHALIRKTLYASLSGPRRMALHRRIGAILEQRPDPPLGELAYHFVAAADPRAVEYSSRAGRLALGALAYEEAVGHFDRALELSGRADERTRCELRLGLGESHGKAGEFEQSRTALQAAADLARTAGLGTHLARAALGSPGDGSSGPDRPGSRRAVGGGTRRATRRGDRAAGAVTRAARDGASLLR